MSVYNLSIEEQAFYASSFYTPLLYALYEGWLLKRPQGLSVTGNV